MTRDPDYFSWLQARRATQGVWPLTWFVSWRDYMMGRRASAAPALHSRVPMPLLVLPAETRFTQVVMWPRHHQ